MKELYKNHTFYFGYGMNTNHREMRLRCPESLFIGISNLSGYKLSFQHVADYTREEGATLLGALWLISDKDEKELDRLEGFPNFYNKHIRKVEFMGSELNAMVYQMVEMDNISPPSSSYKNCLQEGYMESGIKISQLNKALDYCENYHKNVLRRKYNDQTE